MISTTGSATDVFVEDPTHVDAYGGPVFIQLGIIKGLVGWGHCDANQVTLTTPHYFWGGETVANANSDSCETLYDLGAVPAGDESKYHNFGLRRNSDGTYYGKIDQQLVFTSVATWPAAMSPGVIGEHNDACTQVYKDAETSAGGKTLMWYDSHNGWQLWLQQYDDPVSATGYVISRPAGSASSYASGPSSC